MQEAFLNAKFWELFYKMEIELDEAQFEKILSQLKKSFTYREDIIRYEHEGKEKTSIDKVIEFKFDCGAFFSLRLDLLLEHRSGSWANAETKLYLFDKKVGKEHPMAWWDLIRWHPMCIKPDEFELLLEYWSSNDPIWKNTPFPKLLLKNYVGFSDEAVLDVLQEETLEVFKGLITDGYHAIEDTLSFTPFFDGYVWQKHQELGWVYENEEYNCYSIRNECHASGEEGLFPFEEYSRMIDELKNLRID
jgi:hypothetical protein